MGGNLLDEINLWVHPVLVGTGNLGDMLFGEATASKLNLVGNRTLGSGVVVLSCAPAIS